MKFRDRLGQLDRLQRSKRYRIVASIAIVVLSIAAAVTVLYLAQQTTGGEFGEAIQAESQAREELNAVFDNPQALAPEERRARRDAWLEANETLTQLRITRAEEGGLGALNRPEVLNWAYYAIAGFAIVGVAAVWIGLSLTYLALITIGIGVGLPLAAFEPSRGVGLLISGIVPLAIVLLTLLEVGRRLLSPAHPATAIAQNVLNEAVRMKITLVFITILLVLLASTPLILTEDQPLRFRVQQWLQYGGGLGFLVIALMTVFFSCSTVAFEQRDKLVWQTVTKPVAAWHYVTGKWVGIMLLNVVLLGTVSGAVFIFTQYLRFQPADEEIAAFITEEGFDSRDIPMLMTEDRRMLENEVLVARVGVEPEFPELNAEVVDDLVERTIAARQTQNPDLRRTEQLVEEVRQEVVEQAYRQYFSIPQGSAQSYTFTGLDDIARDTDQALTLRYNVQAGTNDPSAIYRLWFSFNGVPWPQPTAIEAAEAVNTAPGVRQVALDAVQLISVPASFISSDGQMTVTIENWLGNPREIFFEIGDIEMLYPVGGYELNFARAMAVLWVKLGFIAAVGIAASTFLSFPVAVLLTLCAFVGAEAAGFLNTSLEQFSAITREGDIVAWKVLARSLTFPVAWLFQSYAELRPIERLTSGRLLGWGELGWTSIQILVWSAISLAVGVLAFRRRELALYSGN